MRFLCHLFLALKQQLFQGMATLLATPPSNNNTPYKMFEWFWGPEICRNSPQKVQGGSIFLDFYLKWGLWSHCATTIFEKYQQNHKLFVFFQVSYQLWMAYVLGLVLWHRHRIHENRSSQGPTFQNSFSSICKGNLSRPSKERKIKSNVIDLPLHCRYELPQIFIIY